MGNQLFQFAFGFTRAAVGDEVSFDVINGFAGDPYRRGYSLQAFQLETREAAAGDIPWGMGWRPPTHLIAKALWTACPKRLRQVHYEKCPFAFSHAAVDPSNPARYFWGYWQNSAYVESVADAMREKMHLKCPSDPFERLQTEIANMCSLSVHVRRYRDLDKRGNVIVNAAKNHGVCDAAYYQKAIHAVPDYLKHRIYVFSDDPEWAKSNLRLPASCCYVADRGSFSAAEELMLMAACRNHVISNSSFSWWGAWLGKNPAKTVVAPRTWNKSLTGDQRAVCPPSWIRL